MYHNSCNNLTERQVRRKLGQWLMPNHSYISYTNAQCVTAANDEYGGRRGCVHAILKTDVFTQKLHPAELQDTFSMHARDWMFAVRHVPLMKLLWSSIVDVALVNSPPVVPHPYHGGLCDAPQHDCFLAATYALEQTSFLSCIVTWKDQELSIQALLDQWVRAGCDLGPTDRKGIRRLACVQMPIPQLHFIKHGLARHFCVDVSQKRNKTLRHWFSQNPSIDSTMQCTQTPDQMAAPYNISFDKSYFITAAKMLRGTWVADSLGDSMKHSVYDIFHWLDSMGASSSMDLQNLNRLRDGTHQGQGFRFMNTMESFLLSLKLCLSLTSDKHLRSVVEDASRIVGMSPGWLSPDSKLASASCLQAKRFQLDAALCSLTREWFDELLDLVANGIDDFSIYFLADASPRVGREWLLMEAFIIKDSDLDIFVDTVRQIQALDQSSHNFTVLEEDLRKQLGGKLHHLVFTPTGMAVGETGLAAKFVCVLHAFWISCAGSWTKIKMLLDRVVALTTDFGTESGLGLVPAVCPDFALPHWSLAELAEPQLIGDGDSDAELPQLPESSPAVGFTRSLSVPGTEHICHNALKAACAKLSSFKDWNKGAQAMSHFLCSRMYRDKIANNLLVGPLESLRHLLKSLGQRLDSRFLSLVAFLGQLLPLKELFLQHWSARIVFGSNNRVGQDTSEDFVDQSLVSSCMLSQEWWCYGEMLYALGQGLSHVVFKSRGCPCHSALPELPQAFRSAWEFLQWKQAALRKHTQRPCPAKGLNAPEFSTGKVREIIENSYNQLSHFLLEDFRGLIKEAQDRLLNDWEQGIQHIKYEAMLKFTFWEQLPYVAWAGTQEPQAILMWYFPAQNLLVLRFGGPITVMPSLDLRDIQFELSMSMCDFFVLHPHYNKSWMHARSWRPGGDWLIQMRPYSIHRYGWESHFRSFGIGHSSNVSIAYHQMMWHYNFSEDAGSSPHRVSHHI